MSKHTDKTNQMTIRFLNDINDYKHNYNIKFRTSEPHNKDNETLKYLMDKFRAVERLATNWDYKVEYKIVSTPEKKYGYNCIGCRKRKSGDYLLFGYDLIPHDKNHCGWFNQIGKVCSPECAEMMTVRLM